MAQSLAQSTLLIELILYTKVKLREGSNGNPFLLPFSKKIAVRAWPLFAARPNLSKHKLSQKCTTMN
jgi:hypothetical protein